MSLGVKILNPSIIECIKSMKESKIPDESTLRKSFLKNSHEGRNEELRNYLSKTPFSISLDSTTKFNKSHLTCILVKTYCATHLLSVHTPQRSERMNANYYLKLLTEVLETEPALDPSNVTEICTDNCPTMTCFQDKSRQLCPKMLPGHCLSHLLNTIEKAVLNSADGVVDLIIGVRNSLFGKGPLGDRIDNLHAFEEDGMSLSAADISSINSNAVRWHSQVSAGSTILRQRKVLLAFFLKCESTCETVRQAITRLSSEEVIIKLIVVDELLKDFDNLIHHSEGQRNTFTNKDRYILRSWFADVNEASLDEKNCHLNLRMAERILDFVGSNGRISKKQRCLAHQTLRTACEVSIKKWKRHGMVEMMLKLSEVINSFIPSQALDALHDFTNMNGSTKYVMHYLGLDTFPELSTGIEQQTHMAVEAKQYIRWLRQTSITNPTLLSENGFEPSEFWSSDGYGHKNYPQLTKLARRALSLTISNGPVESAFSKLRSIDEKRRQSMSPELLSAYMFYGWNKPLSAETNHEFIFRYK